MGTLHYRREHDHIGNFNFRVEIEGVTLAAFQNVEGLESETDIIGVDDGDADGTMDIKRPGRTKYANLKLKRGFVNSDELWKWRKHVIDGKVERKSGSLILASDDGTEIMRYNFFEAWPTKWQGFKLDGGQSQTTLEEIELAVERLELG